MGSEERAAVVTGAGRGIGRAISLALAQSGYRVALLDILADNARAVQKEVESLGREALPIGVDLTRRSDVEAAINQALGRFGQIHTLVNNAGWDKVQPFLENEESTWERIIAINYKAILYTCKALLPHMVARGSGKVINIASDAGRVGSTGEAVYAGAKGAVISFSKALAREMARSKITVNVVCPGVTETPLLQEIRESSEKAHKVLDAVTRAIPLGRAGTPEDVAAAVAFLASPQADFITGQTISVNGGLTMC